VAMTWAKNKAAQRAASEYERVRRVVEEILAEKFAPPLHLQPCPTQEVREEKG